MYPSRSDISLSRRRTKKPVTISVQLELESKPHKMRRKGSACGDRQRTPDETALPRALRSLIPAALDGSRLDPFVRLPIVATPRMRFLFDHCELMQSVRARYGLMFDSPHIHMQIYRSGAKCSLAAVDPRPGHLLPYSYALCFLPERTIWRLYGKRQHHCGGARLLRCRPKFCQQQAG